MRVVGFGSRVCALYFIGQKRPNAVNDAKPRVLHRQTAPRASTTVKICAEFPLYQNGFLEFMAGEKLDLAAGRVAARNMAGKTEGLQSGVRMASAFTIKRSALIVGHLDASSAVPPTLLDRVLLVPQAQVDHYGFVDVS